MPAIPTRLAALAAVVATASLLSACDERPGPMKPISGTVAASRQPLPDKPLFNAPIVDTHSVLPHAKADKHDPLPPAVPLASADDPKTSNGGTTAESGSVNPSAGMGAVITDSKGAQHEADGKP